MKSSMLFASLLLLSALNPANAMLTPKEKTYRIRTLLLFQENSGATLVVNPLSRTRLSIEVQNPKLVRQKMKSGSYMGSVDVEFEFYRTGLRQPMALVKSIQAAKGVVPRYDGDFEVVK